MDPRLAVLFFFLILFLIGFGFSLLTHIPLVQRFLLRSRALRVAGLLLLAMPSFLIGFVFTSRSNAELMFFYGTDVLHGTFHHLMGHGTPDSFLAWANPNKPSIIHELWMETLYPTLSEGTCFSSDPAVCRFAEGTPVLEFVPYVYAMALIPALITFGLGWRYIRRKKQLVAR